MTAAMRTPKRTERVERSKRWSQPAAEQSERASARQVLEISYDEAEEQKALQLQKQKTAPNVAAPSA